jgi:hypothetical protein
MSFDRLGYRNNRQAGSRDCEVSYPSHIQPIKEEQSARRLAPKSVQASDPAWERGSVQASAPAYPPAWPLVPKLVSAWVWALVLRKCRECRPATALGYRWEKRQATVRLKLRAFPQGAAWVRRETAEQDVFPMW